MEWLCSVAKHFVGLNFQLIALKAAAFVSPTIADRAGTLSEDFGNLIHELSLLGETIVHIFRRAFVKPSIDRIFDRFAFN
jgi:hypothetical protein